MIEGHGDDLYAYQGKIGHNFSSNILSGVEHGKLLEAMTASGGGFENYPEPRPMRLESKLAGTLGVGSENVCVTNGATEAIYLIAHAFQGEASAIVVPTFSEYEDACVMYRHALRFITSPEEMQGDERMVWMCNPNNPTGKVFPKRKLQQLVAAYPEVTFVIDGAYSDYTELPVLTPAEAVEAGNVILLGSFTKRYSVPGLRVGYMVGAETLMESINRYRMPWSVSAPAILGAEYLLDHSDDYIIDASRLHNEAERLACRLRSLGVVVEPTDCNFILCRLPERTAGELKEYLVAEHGILIRDASNFRGLDERYFRVAAQKPEENDLLFSVVERWINAGSTPKINLK
jgi:threonine-phosphate decarboxylase